MGKLDQRAAARSALESSLESAWAALRVLQVSNAPASGGAVVQAIDLANAVQAQCGPAFRKRMKRKSSVAGPIGPDAEARRRGRAVGDVLANAPYNPERE